MTNHGNPPADYPRGGPTHANGIYHDNGSGGFTDTLNVIEGEWAYYCALGLSDGGFGLGKNCPGRNGTQEDCMVWFSYNYLHSTSGSPGEGCIGGYSKKKYNKGQWVGGNGTGNMYIAPTSPLPANASAIAAAAGPRV